MTGTPPILRLVSSNDNDATAAPNGGNSFVSDWQSLCESFTEATGTRLAFRGPHDPAFPADASWETEVPAAGPYAPGTLGLLKQNSKPKSSNSSNATSADTIEALAKHIGELAQQLHQSHRALWQRNAELATAIPMVVDTHEESSQLAKRFAALLASAARAAGGDSAAMFVLDDATQLLQLRAHSGLNHGVFTEAPRELRDCTADLEALAGHAIVLDDATDSRELLPEIVTQNDGTPGAAICVPISSATVPLGTLWIFANDPTTFSDIQIDMVEIIAGRLATEMEREILLREQGALGNSGRVHDAIEWQHNQSPASTEIECYTPDTSDTNLWQLAARPASQTRLSGDFYRWRAEPNNNLSLLLTSSHARGMPAALSAARISGIASSLSYESPVMSVSQIGDLLWSGSAGDDQASIFLGQLNQATGKVQFSAAGMIDVYAIRPHGWEPIVQLNGLPIGCHGCDESHAADGNPNNLNELKSYECTLLSGDTLLVLSGRPRLRARSMVEGQVDGPHYAEAALHHNHLDANQLTTLLAGLWDHQTSPWAMPPAQLVARRC